MTALGASLMQAGTWCTWCTRAAESGEAWIVDASGWVYCSPICYARTIDATTAAESLTDGDAHGRARFTDALTHVMRALSMLVQGA
jgi:hypothetical protein